MKNFSELMQAYAVESGEVQVELPVPENNDVLVEVLTDNLAAQGDLGVVDTLDRSEQAVDIAVQLDELADRAEAVETATEMAPEVLAVSVESLHREYHVIMRANKLSFSASSFESAGSDIDRVTGIKKDARRVAELNRRFGETLIDYSEEGAISKFLRNDVSKLDKARGSLQDAGKRLQKDIDALREKPVTIKNEGFARFMTRESRPVRDLEEAITTEAKYLSGAHDAVEQAVKALQDAAGKLAGSGVGSAIGSLKSAQLFTAIEKAESGKGELMGNYTIKRDGAGDGLTVPKFTRSSESGVSLKAAGAGAVGAAAGAWGAHGLMSIIVLGGLVLGAPAVAAAASAAKLGVMAAGAVAGGVNSHNRQKEMSTAQSRASAAELQKAIQAVLGYSKYTDYSLDADAIQKLLKEARGNSADLSDEQKKDLGVIVSSLETSLNRLVRLADEIYEQAYYTTTMMSSVIDTVVNRLK